MSHSGDVLFRWRSYAPLALLPLALGPLLVKHTDVQLSWELVAGGVALAGQALRCYISGTAPDGTSERSTTAPRAALLNTRGVYSVVRHPLYVANTLTTFGLALFPARWDVALIVLLASWLYYERIAIREEVFLESRFGDEFRAWAEHVPAMWPKLSGWVPPLQAFSWSRALQREYHGFFAIAAALLVFDLADDSVPAGALRVSAVWLWLCAAAAMLFITMVLLRKVARRVPDVAAR